MTGESHWNNRMEKESVQSRLVISPQTDKLRKVKDSGITKKGLASDRLKKLQSKLADEIIQSNQNEEVKDKANNNQLHVRNNNPAVKEDNNSINTVKLSSRKRKADVEQFQKTNVDERLKQVRRNEHNAEEQFQKTNVYERLKQVRRNAEEAKSNAEEQFQKTNVDERLKQVRRNEQNAKSNAEEQFQKTNVDERLKQVRRNEQIAKSNAEGQFLKTNVDERLKQVRRSEQNARNNAEEQFQKTNVDERLKQADPEKGIIEALFSSITNVAHSVKSFFRMNSCEEDKDQLSSPANARLSKFRENLNTKLEDYDIVMSDISTTETSNKSNREEEMDWEDIPECLALKEVSTIRQQENTKNTNNDVYFNYQQGNDFFCGSEEERFEKYFFIVIDTNVFLSHMKSIVFLLEKKYKYGQPILIVPYIVLQELDRIKTRNNADNIGVTARKSINFIYRMLKNRDRKVIGQSAIQAKNKIVEIENADDNIINCCLQISESINKSTGVILLSNDNNLRNKALVNRIDAFSFSELINDGDSLKFNS